MGSISYRNAGELVAMWTDILPLMVWVVLNVSLWMFIV